jgi:hypothetical protein
VFIIYALARILAVTVVNYKTAILFGLSGEFLLPFCTHCWQNGAWGRVGQRYNAGGTAGRDMKDGRWHFKPVMVYVMGGA